MLRVVGGEAADRDDLACEVFAQLGEIYLVRTAYDGVTECVKRLRDCLDAYAALPQRSADIEHAFDFDTVVFSEFEHKAREVTVLVCGNHSGFR